MKLKAVLLGCALSLGALPGGIVFTGVACASIGPSAALVVDTGSGVTTLCVDLPSSSVSGTKLLQLAGEQHGLQYRIESGAVCQLAGTGPSEGDCFGEYPNFWGYWRAEGSSDWAWSSAGAATTTVEAGDVEGWSWGSGSDGSSHPRPPSTPYDSVCASAAPEPEEKPETGGGEGDGSEDSGTSEPGEGAENDDPNATTEGTAENDDPTAGDVGDADDKKRKKRKGGSEPKPAEKDADDPEDGELSEDDGDPKAAPALPAGDEAEGPPMVGLAGLGAALLLGGAGALVARRRRTR